MSLFERYSLPVVINCIRGVPFNRSLSAIFRKGGFSLSELESMHLPGTPRYAGSSDWGVAGPA